MEDQPVGRYGTIHYMSNSGSEVPLASYPIDEPVINIGRSDQDTCHIRLFDTWCSDLHCKIVFEDGKAFLIILGQNGVIVDGSNFIPDEHSGQPTTVPLTNGSEWLIYKRRFIFQYPPKEKRAAYAAQLATPAPSSKRRKSLRMSMVNSAQLWTPSAAPVDLADSLRALKNPMVLFPEEGGKEVRIVEGETLNFVSNEQEVVVLESVDAPVAEKKELNPASTGSGSESKTPGKRRQSNLHRQVLLMNSRKKVDPGDEESEEREVEASIFPDEEDSDNELEEDAESNPFISRTKVRKSKREEEEVPDKPLTAKSFRESLGAIGSVLPFGRPSGGVVHSPMPQEKAAEPSNPDQVPSDPQTPNRPQNLGAFFTPQVQRGERLQGRQSVGGSAIKYANIDEDLERARQRLANMSSVSRPKMVTIPSDELPSASKAPAPRSTKRPRNSLANIPELDSPLPPYKSGMATIPEPASSPLKQAKGDGDDDSEDDDAAMRLQKLLRTVERVNHRESIRESRKSMVGAPEFYTDLTEPESPTRATAPSQKMIPADAPDGQSLEASDAMDIDAPVVIASTDAEQDAVTEETKPAKRAGAKKPAVPKTTKRKAQEAADQDMEVDKTESLRSSASSQVEPTPPIENKKKSGRTFSGGRSKQTARKAHEPPVGRARVPAHLQVKEEPESSVMDTSSIDMESQPDSSTISGSTRRSTQGEGTNMTTKGAKSTTTRSTRSRGTVKEEPEQEVEASVSEVDKSTASRTRSGRRGKVAIPSSDSVRDEEPESSVVEPAEPKQAAKRTTRGKAAAKTTDNEVPQGEDEDSTSAIPKRSTTRKTTKVKATSTPAPDEDVVMEDSEPSAKKTSRSIRRVKEEPQEVETVAEETKPKRSTRTKR